MSRKSSSQPTEVELAILNVIWKRGSASVRQVHEELKGSKAPGYTTTLKMMQVMLEKKLLLRDDSSSIHFYQAFKPESEVKKNLVDDLILKAFGGSVHQLVMSAVGSKKVDPSELLEIRKLLKKI